MLVSDWEVCWGSSDSESVYMVVISDIEGADSEKTAHVEERIPFSAVQQAMSKALALPCHSRQERAVSHDHNT